jgi:UDP-N-acetylmuramate--alanine ligase
MSTTTETNSLLRLFPTGLSGIHIHAMGAGGIGISTVIQLAQARGAYVTGCDQAETSMSHFLSGRGVPIAVGHDPSHVLQTDRPIDLVVNAPAVTALNPDQAELIAAREAGIPVVDWQELLGYCMVGSVGVSVAGVHGKGSVTALLGWLAERGGLDPTVEVGAVVPAWGTNVRIGQDCFFINEADEWNYNFLHYHPRVVALNAIEFDHPEYFASYEDIRGAFLRFIAGMDLAQRRSDASGPRPTIVLNADNAGCRDVRAQLGPDWPGEYRTFGMETADVDVRGTDVRVGGETSFELWLRGKSLGRVRLRTPGAHNVANALAAVATADVLGVPEEVFVPGLESFAGLRRRFEISEDERGVTYVDDYAHHPHAVALTLEAARQRFPGRRIVAVFQPTLYTRLYRFLTPFSEAFDAADGAVIVEIQPSRERDTGLVHGNDLVRAIQERPVFAGREANVLYGGNIDETVAQLRPMLQSSDVLVVMGSGPVNRIIPPLRDA